MSDDLGDALDGLMEPVEGGQAEQAKARKKDAEWRPGFSWNGDDGQVTTEPIPGDKPPEWKAVLQVFELDPDEFQVVEPVLFNAWHGPSAEGPVLYRQWKAKVIRRRAEGAIDVDDLVEEIRKHKPLKRQPPEGDGAFVVMLSDWQIGKADGDGTKGTVNRILTAIDDVEQRVRELRRIGRKLGTLVCLWSGDSVEGCVGHYDQQTFTVELDRRSQVKVARRLLRDALKVWSRHFEKVLVVAVAGNHGENRNANGKSFTTFGDNDDLAIVEGVAEALAENPERYGHVEFVIPKQQLSVTVEVSGWVLGLTHGHVARASGIPETKLRSWFEKQAAGKQPIGSADVLASGHYHNLAVRDWGGAMWLQAPAMDGGSDWWTYRMGDTAQTGVLTWVMTPRDRVADIALLGSHGPSTPS